MTSSTHAYAARLAAQGMPLAHISRATGLAVEDISYMEVKQREAYAPPSKPDPVSHRVATPRHGSMNARKVFAESCERLGVDPADILGDNRARRLSQPRQEIMFDLFVLCPRLSYPSLGLLFNRDHTTVLHGVRAHCERIGMAYEEAVALRHMNVGNLKCSNEVVFEIMMQKYGKVMGVVN